MFAVLWQVFQGTPSEPTHTPHYFPGGQVQEGCQSGWRPHHPEWSCSALLSGSPQPGDCLTTGRPTRLQCPQGVAEPEAAQAKEHEGKALVLRLLAPGRMCPPTLLTVARGPVGHLVSRQAEGLSGTRAVTALALFSASWDNGSRPGCPSAPKPSSVAQGQVRCLGFKGRIVPWGRSWGRRASPQEPAHSLRERLPSAATTLALRLLQQEGLGASPLGALASLGGSGA